MLGKEGNKTGPTYFTWQVNAVVATSPVTPRLPFPIPVTGDNWNSCHMSSPIPPGHNAGSLLKVWRPNFLISGRTSSSGLCYYVRGRPGRLPGKKQRRNRHPHQNAVTPPPLLSAGGRLAVSRSVWFSLHSFTVFCFIFCINFVHVQSGRFGIKNWVSSFSWTFVGLQPPMETSGWAEQCGTSHAEFLTYHCSLAPMVMGSCTPFFALKKQTQRMILLQVLKGCF